MLWTLAPPKNRTEFDERSDTDFAHATEEARFRVNVFADRHGIGAVMRQIPSRSAPPRRSASRRPSSTCASSPRGSCSSRGPPAPASPRRWPAMVDYVNRNRDDHIITIEDPVEFVHENQRAS